MHFAGDAYGLRPAIGERKLLLMTALTAASAIDRQACVIEQAPAEFHLVNRNAIGVWYGWWCEARWQMPVELDRGIRLFLTFLRIRRARSQQYGGAGNDTRPPGK